MAINDHIVDGFLQLCFLGISDMQVHKIKRYTSCINLLRVQQEQVSKTTFVVCQLGMVDQIQSLSQILMTGKLEFSNYDKLI